MLSEQIVTTGPAEMLSAAALARRLDVTYPTLLYRLEAAGIVEDALAPGGRRLFAAARLEAIRQAIAPDAIKAAVIGDAFDRAARGPEILA